MFFVFNKRKINSYLISIGTVLMLLSVSLFMNESDSKLIETGATNIKVEPIYRVETQKKKVSISINCSENVENIEKIIDVLSKMNEKATFFVSGKVAETYPDKIKKIEKSGNEIGIFSYNYKNLKKLEVEEVKKEIEMGIKTIEKITNKKVKIFRAPFGECNDLIVEEAKKQKLTTVQWSLDSLDYNGLDGEEMCERIDEGLMPGNIILLHNTGKNTVNSIESIIKTIKSKEYEICKVSELIKLQK